ncbi:MAG: ABC transporter permease [Actinobacteria bacterium]|nr:ABC transporter permease [Actinomycetota bacterium]
MNLVGLRASARIARRSAIRHRKRTILILVLIAIPVAAAIVVAGINRANKLDPERLVSSTFGAAEVVITADTSDPEIDAWVTEQISNEPSADSLRYRKLEVRLGLVVSPDLGDRVRLSDIDFTNPLARGTTVLADGTEPSRRGDIALSVNLAQRLQVRSGDTIELTLGGASPLTYSITGLVQDPISVRRVFAIVTPEEMTDVIARVDAQAQVRGNERIDEFRLRTTWLLGGVDGEFAPRILRAWERDRDEFLPPAAVDPQPQELEPHSDDTRLSFIWVDAESRQDRLLGMARDDSALTGSPVVGTMVAALLLVEVALVAGAAYATGTRRRLREIGLLGSSGATEMHIRTIIVGEGVVAGLVGAAIGAAIAVSLLIAGRPFLQLLVDQLIVEPPITAVDILGPMAVGILAATVAAWIPARTAAGVLTVTALQGRMPEKPQRRWVAPAGLGLVGFGALLVVVAKVAFGQGAAIQAGLGVIFMIAGAALLTGSIVTAAGSIADRFRATPRLVLRDAARQRSRASVATAAVMVVLLGPVIMGVSIANARVGQAIHGLPAPANHIVVVGQYNADGYTEAGTATAEDVEAVRSVIPNSEMALIATLDARIVFQAEGVAVATLSSRRSVEGYEQEFLREDVRAAVGTPALATVLGDPAIAQALESGEAVVLGVKNRATTLTVNGIEINATEIAIPVASWAMPRLLLPQSMVDSLDLQTAGTKALFVTEEPLTVESAYAIWNLDFTVDISPIRPFSLQQSLWLGLGATFLVVLGIIGLITALSATESDRDLAMMVAVGAPPTMRRRFLGLQTAFFAFFAGLLAAPLGWLLMKVSADNSDWVIIGPFGTVPSGIATVPWGVIAVVVLVIPAAVGGVTALVVKSSPTMPARQAL